MKIFFLLLSLLSLSCSVTAESTTDVTKVEFKKFFKTDMPNIQPDGAIYLDPKNSDVIPIQEQPAYISVRITVPGLSKLLILHGKNKYPDKVCKPSSKQTFVASYQFNPDNNVSHKLASMRAECSSNIIVWAQTQDGKFYKAEKLLRVFHFHP